MPRQHCAPVLLTSFGSGEALVPLGQQSGDGMVSEAEMQALVHAHPGSLPIAEIDPLFAGALPVCTELNTPAGAIDNLLMTPSGLPVLVECKLWRNPEGRREVVGQILDYAKELTRWSSSDLQREVSRRLKREGNPLLDLMRAADPLLDEVQFNDAVTANLRRGRFLLLILGDGIREGVETIAEYLQAHAGLHFSLGLIEMPIYLMPNGARLVVPRVLARTLVVTRNVVALPDGYALQQQQELASATEEIDPERSAIADEHQRFWTDFLAVLKLDDPEQSRPKPARWGALGFMLPAPNAASWLHVYRDKGRGELGVYLGYSKNSAGEYAMRTIAEDWATVKDELGGNATITQQKDGRVRIGDARSVGSLDEPEIRKAGFAWLADRVNTFVNVIRPRVRSAVMDYQEANSGLNATSS